LLGGVGAMLLRGERGSGASLEPVRRDPPTGEQGAQDDPSLRRIRGLERDVARLTRSLQELALRESEPVQAGALQPSEVNGPEQVDSPEADELAPEDAVLLANLQAQEQAAVQRKELSRKFAEAPPDPARTQEMQAEFRQLLELPELDGLDVPELECSADACKASLVSTGQPLAFLVPLVAMRLPDGVGGGTFVRGEDERSGIYYLHNW